LEIIADRKRDQASAEVMLEIKKKKNQGYSLEKKGAALQIVEEKACSHRNLVVSGRLSKN